LKESLLVGKKVKQLVDQMVEKKAEMKVGV
jgi:hypothetical protein